MQSIILVQCGDKQCIIKIWFIQVISCLYLGFCSSCDEQTQNTSTYLYVLIHLCSNLNVILVHLESLTGNSIESMGTFFCTLSILNKNVNLELPTPKNRKKCQHNDRVVAYICINLQVHMCGSSVDLIFGNQMHLRIQTNLHDIFCYLNI